MTYERKIAKRIKEARVATGLSQRGMARKLGLTGAYISYLEQGKRNLDVKLLKKIADLTGVHPLYFFGERKPARKETGKSLFLESHEAAVMLVAGVVATYIFGESAVDAARVLKGN